LPLRCSELVAAAPVESVELLSAQPHSTSDKAEADAHCATCKDTDLSVADDMFRIVDAP